MPVKALKLCDAGQSILTHLANPGQFCPCSYGIINMPAGPAV